jgi:hypothetical protein
MNRVAGSDVPSNSRGCDEATGSLHGVERCRSDTGGIGRAEQELDGPGSCGVANFGDLRREKPDKAADRG